MQDNTKAPSFVNNLLRGKVSVHITICWIMAGAPPFMVGSRTFIPPFLLYAIDLSRLQMVFEW